MLFQFLGRHGRRITANSKPVLGNCVPKTKKTQHDSSTLPSQQRQRRHIYVSSRPAWFTYRVPARAI